MTIKANKRVETWTIYTECNSKQWRLKRIRALKLEQYIQNKIVSSDDQSEHESWNMSNIYRIK